MRVVAAAEEAGQPRDAATKALETGSAALQDVTPVKQISIYLVGLHPMKDDPKPQVIAHHLCNQVNEDLARVDERPRRQAAVRRRALGLVVQR